MNRLTGSLLIVAVLALAGCGGGGGGDTGGSGGTPTATTSDAVTLATKMINEATSEECPTAEHCTVWPVESLATIPDDEKAVDL